MLVFQARVIHMIPCFSRRRYTLMTGKDPSLTLTLFDKTSSQHLKICTSRFLETGELPMFQPKKKTSIFGQTSGRSCSNNPRFFIPCSYRPPTTYRPPSNSHQRASPWKCLCLGSMGTASAAMERGRSRPNISKRHDSMYLLERGFL